MRKTLKWLGATAIAGALVFGFTTTASALAPADAAMSRVNEAGHVLPPIREYVKPVAARPAAVPMTVAATSPSSLNFRCYPANTFLSGGEAAGWLGSSVAGDSSWPMSPEPPNRVRAANGGWVGGAGTWAMVSPGADHMTRIYVNFQNRC